MPCLALIRATGDDQFDGRTIPVAAGLAAGLPLVFDGDHLSGRGNDLLYPSLRAAILNARRPRLPAGHDRAPIEFRP
jgi:hypothetical protein